MSKVLLLDAGYVQFIEGWGSDERIVEAARMSTDKGFLGWGTPEKPKDERLLRHLYTKKHSSPFEMGGMVVEVKAPIFVFREWMRHRTQCLSGKSLLTFNRPCDGKSYPMKLEDLYKKWNTPPAKRHRKDQSPLTLAELHRSRIGQMQLRAPGGSEQVTDVWASGEKKVYRVVTDHGVVVASSDHLFKTPDGSARICDGLDYVMAMRSVGEKKPSEVTRPSLPEEWREVLYGLEVSSHGNVRSYFGQGKRSVQPTPVVKKPSLNPSGRLVVSFQNKVYQVSRLVAVAFGIIDSIGSPELVLHKNDNPMDNHVENLKPGTPADNIQDQYVNGGRRRLREVPTAVRRVEYLGVEMTFDISVTGDHWFVADNLVVHNSYNEMSARYVPLPDENYLPTLERLLSGANTKTTNKQAQGSGKELTADEAYAWLERLSVAYEYIEDVYQYGLQLGIPKELARIVLPVARYSKMRASANLRNWLAFMMLRQSSDAQYEIRVYADAVSDLIRQNFPRTWELYEEERNRGSGKQHSTWWGSLQKLSDRAVGLYRGQWARLFRG